MLGNSEARAQFNIVPVTDLQEKKHEVHGEVVKVFYRKQPEGLLVVEFRNSHALMADCPSSRRTIQNEYSASAHQVLADYMESSSTHTIEVVRRGTNTGVIPIIPDKDGNKIVFMVKNFNGDLKLDLPAGGLNGELDAEKSRRREVAGEEFIAFSEDDKLVLPDGHERETMEYIETNVARAESLKLHIPLRSKQIIANAKQSLLQYSKGPFPFIHSLPKVSAKIPLGNLLSATVVIVGEDGRTTHTQGYYISHRNGGDMVVPWLYPPLASSIDAESLEANKDEEDMPLNRIKCAMNKSELTRYFNGDRIQVQSITKDGLGSINIDRRTVPSCALGEAFIESYLGVRNF